MEIETRFELALCLVSRGVTPNLLLSIHLFLGRKPIPGSKLDSARNQTALSSDRPFRGQESPCIAITLGTPGQRLASRDRQKNLTPPRHWTC